MAKAWVGTQAERELVDQIKVRWQESENAQASFIRAYERRERSYRGAYQSSTKAQKWRHNLRPPYAFNLIETITANMVEMNLRYAVRPDPHMGMSLEEATNMLQQAEAIEDLLAHEYRVDDMDQKQRPFYLIQAIGGRSIGKSHWNWRTASVKRQEVQMVELEEGGLVVPQIVETANDEVIRDHSTFEIVDPRDFVVHESARSLNPFEPGGAQYLFHRNWYSFEQLKMLEASGFVRNIDFLTEERDKESSQQVGGRETEIWGMKREKDLIPVLEYWCMKNGEVHRSMVASDQMVLIQDETTNPFWHGSYPFVCCSAQSQPFTTIGMSEIELIEALQEQLWEMLNHRLDNAELISNWITLIRSDVDDIDAFDFFPGARWPVESTDQVEVLQPPYQVIDASLQAEALLKGDFQNITGSAPFAGGAETATVDQKTATGASMVMSAAQQRLAHKKFQGQITGLVPEAYMRIKNCQQFISDTYLAHVVGEDGKMRFREIDPVAIQGEFIPELTWAGDSQIREMKRAESSQFMQLLMGAAPLAAAAGVPLNVKEIIGWAAEKWDIHDWERFFSQQPAALGAMQAPGGGAPPPGGGAEPEQPNLGITADSAIDAGSPSAVGGISGSPVVALQRALAMGGGTPQGG